LEFFGPSGSEVIRRRSTVAAEIPSVFLDAFDVLDPIERFDGVQQTRQTTSNTAH